MVGFLPYADMVCFWCEVDVNIALHNHVNGVDIETHN